MRFSPRMCFSWTHHSFHDKWESWQTRDAFQRPNAENCAVSSWLSSWDLLTDLMSTSIRQIKTKALNNYNFLKNWQINCWQIKCFLILRLKCFSKPMFPKHLALGSMFATVRLYPYHQYYHPLNSYWITSLFSFKHIFNVTLSYNIWEIYIIFCT